MPCSFPMLTYNLKIGGAILLNHTRKQWVDLGIHTEACITRPETCGEAGAAVAFWMRINRHDINLGSIISSWSIYSAAMIIGVMSNKIRCTTSLQ